MDSFVISPLNQNYTVEQLSDHMVFMDIEAEGQGFTLVSNFTKIKLKPNRVYYIDRMTIMIDLFREANTPQYAYPRYEDFALQMSIDGDVGTLTKVQKPLFRQMAWGTTDGISNTKLFCEPFMFSTDNTDKPYLWLTFYNNGSTIISLTGITLPPTGNNVVDIMGLVSLEGVSYTSNQLKSSI